MKLAIALCAAALVAAPAVASSQVPIDQAQSLVLTIAATDVFTLGNTGNVNITVNATGVAQSFTTQGGTYSVSTNAASTESRDIMVSIASTITDVTVELKLFYSGSNSHGSTNNFVTLSTTPQSAVTGIYGESASAQAITYKITAPVTVSPTTVTKVVTYTLADIP
jgi:hypothetical protein